MRFLLGLTLLITLSASAAAAPRHHFERRHVVMSHSRAHAHVLRGRIFAAPRAPEHFDDTPSYDDPSKFGGGTAL